MFLLFLQWPMLRVRFQPHLFLIIQIVQFTVHLLAVDDLLYPHFAWLKAFKTNVEHSVVLFKFILHNSPLLKLIRNPYHIKLLGCCMLWLPAIKPPAMIGTIPHLCSMIFPATKKLPSCWEFRSQPALITEG